MTDLNKQEKTSGMVFWGEKPATIATMLLQPEESDSLSQAEMSEILNQLPPLNGMRVLELGAGIGRYTCHFAQVASHVTAVDFTENFLDQNRQSTARYDNITYRCTDVMSLEFEDECFDFVFINWLLMYLNDQQTVLLRDRIHKWLRVGGTLFFRESCLWEGLTGGSLKNNPAKYRPDIEYTRLFENDFRLLHRGTVGVYEQRFSIHPQYYWLFSRYRA